MLASFQFWKYVFLFLFVSSLESLLTVKAFDFMDTGAPKSNSNKDLEAQGIGNFVLGLIGALPIISEVVRTTANVGFGAKSAWANFFHGLFLLLFLLFMVPVIECIPNAALAALLIFAGFRLTSPKQYFQTYRVGKEQLALFIITIGVTLASDLLLGVLAGILVKIGFHIYAGVKPHEFFRAKAAFLAHEPSILKVSGPCVFSNILIYRRAFNQAVENGCTAIDFSSCSFIDHSFISFLQQYKSEFEVKVVGLDFLTARSTHPLASRTNGSTKSR